MAEYRQEVEGVISLFEENGHAVFCAPQNDNWKINNASPGEGLALDLMKLDDADIFIAFVYEKVSPGV